MDEELTRLPCCLRTGFPMFVAFSFSSGYKRLSSAMENKPYPRFYGCPHCFFFMKGDLRKCVLAENTLMFV